MTIGYKPSFVREFKKLPIDLQADALDKIELFKDSGNHKRLKVHKLKGKLGNYHSFSVTYSHRIVFCYTSKNEVVFLAIGDHAVYR